MVTDVALAYTTFITVRSRPSLRPSAAPAVFNIIISLQILYPKQKKLQFILSSILESTMCHPEKCSIWPNTGGSSDEANWVGEVKLTQHVLFEFCDAAKSVFSFHCTSLQRAVVMLQSVWTTLALTCAAFLYLFFIKFVYPSNCSRLNHMSWQCTIGNGCDWMC